MQAKVLSTTRAPQQATHNTIIMSPIQATLLACLLSIAFANNLPHILRQADPRRPPCGRRCKFFFCVDRATVFLTAPGSVSNPEICRANQEIDQILETGEALVGLAGGNTVPISKWRPDGLDTPFSPSVFRAAEIPGEDNSGIQRTETRGNQHAFLNNRCFILPIKRYERVVFRRGVKVVVAVNAGNSRRDCVAFVPRVSDITFEAQWLSGDDLDLSVEEPDGSVVDFRERRSECGNLLIDANVDSCDVREEGIERIFYDRNCRRLQRGVYIVRLRHGTNCRLTTPPQPTRYEIRVVVDGIVSQAVRGNSNKDDGQLITSFTFRI